MRFLKNHIKNHRAKTLHKSFTNLMTSEEKILWHTYYYGPKEPQELLRGLRFICFLIFVSEKGN